LQNAYAAGNLDLAMSLAESIKDTLCFERQDGGAADPPQISADEFAAVEELARPWAQWARGWSFCKPLTLIEKAGIERRQEPADIAVAFHSGQASDLQREVRVARVDERSGTLREVASQVYGERRRGSDLLCRIVFLADVSPQDRAAYLIFYGNANAELPRYASDLRWRGEGYGLDIENRHFVARLSRQMGQLERLTFKRDHGLELFAGGKGHGEPPTIDWSCDYVDRGHLQKLRMRNWSRCPNYELAKGPLCIRVRRWGFPHSPLHPVLTPARMHMDQTYVFYAGLPYFLKEGNMDVVSDLEIDAMRDDEWVFSGQSFTDPVWVDAEGKLHEGDVPAEHQANMWGVGFFHRDTRDAFIALRLEHSARGFDAVQHGGMPRMFYEGHGQVWARYPARDARFKVGASFRQKNAYVVLPYAKNAGAGQIERLRRQLLSPLDVRFAEPPRLPNASAAAALARFGETQDTAPLKPTIWKTLREVRDEQLYSIDANIVDMGYVYDLQVRDGIVHVLVTMPHRGRPVYNFLVTQGGGRVSEGIRERLLKLKGVRDVVVDFTWEPAWTPARLSDAARRTLGLADSAIEALGLKHAEGRK
jgi:metal-sulfur cluster biosynthetic enzyme